MFNIFLPVMPDWKDEALVSGITGKYEVSGLKRWGH
jgi:hypothetical protein